MDRNFINNLISDYNDLKDVVDKNNNIEDLLKELSKMNKFINITTRYKNDDYVELNYSNMTIKLFKNDNYLSKNNNKLSINDKFDVWKEPCGWLGTYDINDLLIQEKYDLD